MLSPHTAICVTVLGGSTPRRLQCPAGPIDTQPLNRVDTSARVAALRREMTQVRSVRVPPLDAFIITPDDEHQVTRHPPTLLMGGTFFGIVRVAWMACVDPDYS
uniref:Uncharacterized protein n=1 Tax=Timema monikensis TaxID=170555 RepID=A0A7R9EI81_9NEOP|nr:unnamed protein product [Timema monikensis]